MYNFPAIFQTHLHWHGARQFGIISTMLLKIEDLSVSYRNDEGEVTPAAVDVNLSMDRGEVLGIVGESGSG